jgi:hypothetical protein
MADIIRNFELRFAKVKFGNYSFGLVSDVKFSAKPIELGRDSFGRTVIGGYDVKGEFNIIASDNTTLRSLATMVATMGANILEFDSMQGKIILENVLIKPEMEVDLAGKPSSIKVTFDRYLRLLEFINVFSVVLPENEILPPPVDNIT